MEEKMSRLVIFDQLRNTRDLGGMESLNGRRIIQGKLYRSGHLNSLSGSDKDKLARIAPVIIDFRTDAERKEQPDQEIPGTESIHIPIVDDLTAGISREQGSPMEMFRRFILNPEGTKQYMCDMYRAFASEKSVRKYAAFADLLLNVQNKAVLWHCTAGKDRAGIASVIIEEILGIPRDAIISDYLKTNEYIEQDNSTLSSYVKKQCGTDDPKADESLRYLFGAEREYIETYYQAINEKYGSMDKLIRDGLCITPERMEQMKEKYLAAE
jgi:protein-tyrosine phosphatase